MQSVFYFASPFFFSSFPMKFLYLLCFLLPLIFWACAPDRQTLRLEGEIKGIDQADLLVCEAESSIDTVGLDTLRVRRGKFTYERPLSAPTLLTIIYPNSSTTTFVAEPGTALHLSGDANRLSEVSIKGSDNNDLVTDLRLRLLHKSTSDAQREAASFVRSHAGTLAAVAVFRAYFDEVKQRKLQPALSLLDALQKAQPQQPAVRTLVRRLRPQLLTSPDGKLPAFSAPKLDGSTFSSSTLRGKPALIVFCASWDGSNYATGQALGSVRRALGNRAHVVVICLDASTETAHTLTFADSIPHFLCPEQGLCTPLVQTLGVRYVPGCLVVDADGKIVDRDLPADQWLETMQRLVR